MRLLNVDTLEFEEYLCDVREIPKYAVASHRWKAGTEVGMKDIKRRRNVDKEGYRKVEHFAQYVRENIQHVKLLWIDTCCVNQDSSQEVTEAVTSMFRWYANAEVCLAYLADVQNAGEDGALGRSDWFTRGWTLQELVVPHVVVFLSHDWKDIGYKGGGGRTKSGVLVSAGLGLERSIAAITGITEDVLHDYHRSKSYSVEERLSWINGRQTTRGEDMSYSLIGLFDVSMSVRYGEGADTARKRLLENIFRRPVHAQHQQGPPDPESGNGSDSHHDEQGRALIRACVEDRSAKVLHLLERGAYIEYRNADGLTALHFASLRGFENVVEILLNRGAEVNAQSSDLGTPLCVAALHARENIVALLLRRRAQIHVPGHGVGTPLHCASWSGSLEVVQTLLDHGGDPMLACQLQLELLQYGAAVGSSLAHTVSKRFSEWKYRILECQPMVLAAEKGRLSLVRAFLGAGYSVDATHRIWWTSNPWTYPHRTAAGDIFYEECTALMTASWSGHDSVVAELLAAGTNVKAQDSGGRTALSVALQAGQSECIKILMYAENRKSDEDARKKRMLTNTETDSAITIIERMGQDEGNMAEHENTQTSKMIGNMIQELGAETAKESRKEQTRTSWSFLGMRLPWEFLPMTGGADQTAPKNTP
jgi:ankyrin repeat protein